MSTDRSHEPNRGTDASAPAPAAVPTWQRRDPVAIDPIQYKAWCDHKLAEMAGEPASIQQVANSGISGPTTALPHGDAIQASFGHHDVSDVQAHVGGIAADASAQMGAHAYATGNAVAFAAQPDLRLAAHEAAHVVQQRGGVQLKGGVSESGDAYEQHADAVADAVVAGQSAEHLLSEVSGAGRSDGVQRQAAGAASLDVTVEWSSPFGSDLEGTVTLYGSNDGKAWTKLDDQDVAASNDATFTGVPYYKFYQANIQPIDDVPDDHQAVGQFKETDLTSKAIPTGATQATVKGRLQVNRWNRENVRQRHEKRKIDPAKADESHVASHPLFGRVVKVHDLVAPRVATTDALYQALPPETKAEIAESLYVTGGYAYRNQTGKDGGYSNHSVGMAIDVNANEGKMQNALMEDKNELALLEKVVQPVVRTDPAHASFDVWKDKGQAQLAASHTFNERFPMFLAELLDRSDDVTSLVAADVAVAVGDATGMSAEYVREQTIRDIFATITAPILKKAAKQQKDAKKRRQLELIASNWESLSAWVLGAHVVDEHAGQRDAAGKRLPSENKVAIGMIPLHETVLQMFLDAGWTWGGDWGGGGRKDYMHFEDATLAGQIKKP